MDTLPQHWMPIGLLGANASFQRASREYAEEYAQAAVLAERAACAALCEAEFSIEGIAQRCAAAIRARV